MDSYFVCYDLIKDKDYKKLTDELKSMGASPTLLSNWFLRLEDTSSSELRDHLKEYIDDDDRLLVVKARTWAWFNEIEAPRVE